MTQLASNGFSPAAHDYLRSHGISLETALACGVTEDGGAFVYPPAGRRRQHGSKATRQPRGQPLQGWWVRGTRPSVIALVCEGEGDALAAASHLPNAPTPADLDRLPVLAIPGTGYPVDRLVDDLASAGVRQALLAFDADDAGRSYTERAAAALRTAGIQPAPVLLPDGQDLADVIAATDEPAQWLTHALLDAGCAAEPLDSLNEPAPLRSTWEPVDLVPVLDGQTLDDPPALLPRSDGPRLLYAGRVHALFGEPEACKGWAGLHTASQVLGTGGIVVYIDCEDTAATAVSRLLALSTSRDALATRFLYVRPDEPLLEADASTIALEDLSSAAPALVVIDGVTEAFALQGLDMGDNTDVARWLKLLPRRMADAGAAVVLIDHVVKNRQERQRYAIGAQHKLAGVDVAYSLEVLEPFGRGREGRVRWTVTKDRPGHVRAHQDHGGVIAEMRLSSRDDGGVTVELAAPDRGAGPFRPTYLMERVSRAIEERPGLTSNQLKAAVTGKADAKATALERLVEERHVERTAQGQAYIHRSLTPYREADDPTADPNESTGSQPVPTSSQEPAETTGSPVPPLKGDPEPGLADQTPDAPATGSRPPGAA